MARWKLTEPHYIMVPENYWEQVETDRETGKQKRKKYPVPTHLNPKDPADWNYKSGDRDVSQGGSAFIDGEIIVCYEGKGERKDIVFVGPPTPGMEPLDDEARAESAKAKVDLKWEDRPDRFYSDGMTYADTMLMKLADRAGTVSPEIEAMQKQINDTLALLSQVVAQNAQLLQQLAPQRRV